MTEQRREFLRELTIELAAVRSRPSKPAPELDADMRRLIGVLAGLFTTPRDGVA